MMLKIVAPTLSRAKKASSTARISSWKTKAPNSRARFLDV
jgi:hypothetical protein